MQASQHKAGNKKSGTRRIKVKWARLLLYLAVFIALLVFGGFLGFAYNVSRLDIPSHLAEADGIVVWTGKGGDRLQGGAQLLRSGKGERLLVSGVNSALSAEQLYALLGLDEELTLCCVDLDYEALDTVGNARETARWAQAMGYDHIILVTSAYHMPRAQIEIATASGDLRVTSYPVASKLEKNWWHNMSSFKRISQEFGKLLLTNLKYAGKRSDNRQAGLGGSNLADAP